jgi:perosamine synthetase
MPIPFYRPYFPPESRREVLAGIDRILETGRLMMGEFTTKLEMEFAARHGTELAVSTTSCTAALQMCLMHFDVRGREVLVPSAAFITDISVIKWAGGIPVLVDVDPKTLAFDPEDLKRKITANTRGMIWVHLVGLVSPAWEEILRIARERKLFVIEDCAHAHGASVAGGRMAGSLGDAGCFSFYPTKVMTSGTGGMMITSNPELAKSVREIRMFGHGNGDRSNRVIREGNDWFLDEIRACVAYSQLRDLDHFLGRRRELAAVYQRRLAGVRGLRRLEVPPGNNPAWYNYPVFVDGALDYGKIAKTLSQEYGVPTKPIYIPLHQEAIFLDLNDGTLTATEEALNRSLCLPLFVEMEVREAEQVADAVTAVMEQAAVGLDAAVA